ncbi:hypothetical protein Bca4012_001710 [Brassica carinata]
MAITSEIDQKNAKDPSIAKVNIITAPLQRIMHQNANRTRVCTVAGNLQDNSPRDDISSWNCKQKSIPMDIPFNIAHGSKDASFVRVVSKNTMDPTIGLANIITAPLRQIYTSRQSNPGLYRGKVLFYH